MLLVFDSRGWAAGNMSVSPVAGVPAKPQLPLSFQLPPLPPPDQLKVAALLLKIGRTSAQVAGIASNRKENNLEDAVWRNTLGCDFFISMVKLLLTFYSGKTSTRLHDFF